MSGSSSLPKATERSALAVQPFLYNYSTLSAAPHTDQKRFVRVDSKGRKTLLTGDDVENQIKTSGVITHEIDPAGNIKSESTSERATLDEKSNSPHVPYIILDFKETVVITADEGAKKKFLAKLIGFAKEHIVEILTFSLSAGVIAPVFPASQSCNTDEKCQGLFGPLDASIKNPTLLNIGGSANYLAANALYASLESRHAWEFFLKSSTPQKLIFLCLVLPSLCAQETIFALAQGSGVFWTAVASTGAAPGALFAFMQLMKIYESAPWQDFKWKYLLGTLYKPNTGEEAEMLHYSLMRKKLLELLKADFDVLAKKLKAGQFPADFPSRKSNNNWIEFLLKQEARVSPESACSRNTRRIFRGLGIAFAGWIMSPNTVNTFKFLEENIGDEFYVVPLNVILSGFLLTKNIYAMTLFLGDFFSGIYDALRNKVLGKENEWALLRMQRKLKLVAAVLTISATLHLTSWSGQTLFTLMKKNSQEFQNDDLNTATLKACSFTHFIVAMKAVDQLLSEILLTTQEKFLRDLQKEISRVEAMNFANFKKLFTSLIQSPGMKKILEDAGINPHLKLLIRNPNLPSMNGVNVQLSPLRSNAYTVPQPLRNHRVKVVAQSVPWYRKIFCCGKRPPTPNPDAVVVQQNSLSPK